MAEYRDPVCGMVVDTETASANTTFESREVYFCSDYCRREFEKEPARYVDKLERHEPPYTVKGFAAPKFGSAVSGGLEYERGPERHDED